MSGPDARLAAVRRVDWRFLLPHPSLGRVACLGPIPDDLRAGLAACGATMVDLAWDDLASKSDELTPHPHLPRCDIVLTTVNEPNSSEARPRHPSAWRPLLPHILVPGGHVVVEVHGWRARLGRRRPFGPAAWVAALRRAGLRDAGAYWHIPTFEACQQIVPLASPAALTVAVARSGGPRAARAVAGLARPIGGLPLLARSFSVTATWPGEAAA